AITSGKIYVAGQRMKKPRTNIGAIFQDPTLLASKFLFDNHMLPVNFLKPPRREYEERVKHLVELVGLQGFADKRPRELSGGMRQPGALCRSAGHDPRGR